MVLEKNTARKGRRYVSFHLHLHKQAPPSPVDDKAYSKIIFCSLLQDELVLL